MEIQVWKLQWLTNLVSWWTAALSCHPWTTYSWLPQPERTALRRLRHKRQTRTFSVPFLWRRNRCCFSRGLPTSQMRRNPMYALDFEALSQEALRGDWFSKLTKEETASGWREHLISTDRILFFFYPSVWLTCSEASLLDLIRHLGVELFILMQLGPHAPPASLAPGASPTLSTSTPTFPLNQVCNAPLGHRRRLGDVLLYRGHQAWTEKEKERKGCIFITRIRLRADRLKTGHKCANRDTRR